VQDGPPTGELLIPLRSNAFGLLAGSPVEAVRRRLKFASTFYESILLEAGALRITAGPGGSFVEVSGDSQDARFQTPRERASVRGQSFVVNMGAETQPGVAASRMHTIIESESAIGWSATLAPFLRELPGEADWFHPVRTSDPTGPAGSLVRNWTTADLRSDSVRKSIPEQFVRSLVVKHANRDLVIAAAAGIAVSQDSLHRRVLDQRFNDAADLRPTGFAMPILFPNVGDLSWQQIMELRNHKAMVRFRSIIREVEAGALARANGGDLEAAAHATYRDYLSRAAGPLDTLPSILKRSPISLVLGGAAGAATMGITGPLGVAVGAVLGTGLDSGTQAVKALRARGDRAWLSVHRQLTSESDG
jgi:hypothetical protein